MTFSFDNSYVRLPERFYAKVAPTSATAPKLIRLNRDLALQLGLDPEWLESPRGIEVLAGKRVAEGSEPIAMAMPGTSLAVSCRSWAMVAPFCSARSSTRLGYGVTFI